MPNKPSDIQEWRERLIKLEVKMETVMSFNKWQTGLLAGIILMLAKAIIWR